MIYTHYSRMPSVADQDISKFSLTHIFAKYPGKTVAMGCAITTKKISSAEEMINSSLYFTQLLPSFCKTASPGYFYMFYMGFDFNDTILSFPVGRKAFRKYFHSITTNMIKGEFEVDVRFVPCNHSGKMAWAHNDALVTAYRAGLDYFYMVNDDTIMKSKNWTNIYVEQLAAFYPPNVGIVGPNHNGGNTDILTYFFSHRTHIDIFHFFFPRIFVDWFADDWLSHLYEPNNVKKMPNVLLHHTREQGTRYVKHKEPMLNVGDVLTVHREILRNYLVGHGIDWDVWKYKPALLTTNTSMDK